MVWSFSKTMIWRGPLVLATVKWNVLWLELNSYLVPIVQVSRLMPLYIIHSSSPRTNYCLRCTLRQWLIPWSIIHSIGRVSPQWNQANISEVRGQHNMECFLSVTMAMSGHIYTRWYYLGTRYLKDSSDSWSSCISVTTFEAIQSGTSLVSNSHPS